VSVVPGFRGDFGWEVYCTQDTRRCLLLGEAIGVVRMGRISTQESNSAQASRKITPSKRGVSRV
jgi:hypothetical protein